MDKLHDIAKNFDINGEVKTVRSLGEGLINDTFLIVTKGDSPDYILQRKNKQIFQDIPAMMQNIYNVTTHLKKKIVETGGDPMRETMTVVPTKDGKLYYQDELGDYWAACVFIEDTITHQYANNLQLAYQGGKGIGKFQSMLSDMKEPLTDILPGFHNMKFRFEQWDKALADDLANRKKDLSEEIQKIEQYRDEMLAFWQKVETGVIPMRVTHNDGKISNILFDRQEQVLCVIDLDTVLNSTCLNDYGDAIRSYTNAGLEDDRHLENVYVQMDIFESYTKGYLSEAASFMTQSELDNLAFSAKYITFEQTLRFLLDYLNGDTYYKIAYADHNLVRTHSQFKLLSSIDENFEKMLAIVENSLQELA